MTQDFISKFEEDLKAFELGLRSRILDLFKSSRELTTADIIRTLRDDSKEFELIYIKNSTKAWYRARKILEELRKRGFLSRAHHFGTVKKLNFPTYKWRVIENALCRDCKKPLEDHRTIDWAECWQEARKLPFKTKPPKASGKA